MRVNVSVRDEDMDGEWEAPQIPNPACEAAPGCGIWKRPTIENPNYKGKWKASMIDNPNYQVTCQNRRCSSGIFVPSNYIVVGELHLDKGGTLSPFYGIFAIKKLCWG